MSRKRAAIEVGLIALMFLNSSMVPAFAISATQTAEYNQFNNQGVCTYFIFTDGTYYYAQDASTGVIAYGSASNLGSATGTNATQVFRSTIGALASSGGTICVGLGTFTFSGTKIDRASIKYTLAMKTGVNLLGASKTGTILKQAASTLSSFIVADQLGVGQANDWSVSGLTVDGTRASQSASGVDGNQACFYLNQNQRISLQRLIIQNCFYQGVYDSFNGATTANDLYIATTGFEGYSVSGTNYGAYSGIRVTGTGVQAGATIFQSGFYVSGPAYKNTISGVTSYSNTGVGVGLASDGGTHDNHDNTFTGINTFSNARQGVLVGDNASATTWVAGNKFFGVTSEGDGATGSAGGIEFLGANASLLSGATVINAHGASLTFANAHDNLVVGLVAYDNQGSHTTTYFIRESNGSLNNTISGGFVPATGFLSAQYSMLTTSRSVINNVAGLNPKAADDVNAGTSVWTYTNTDPWMESMILKTANGISAETCQSVSGFPTSVGTTCTLRPGDTMTVTWSSSAPVYHRVPLDKG